MIRARRRQVLSGAVGLATIAMLDGSCGPQMGGRAAPKQRRYSVGWLKGHDVRQCEGQPSDWQTADWGYLRSGASSVPLAPRCPAEAVILRTLGQRGYRIGENLELTIASPPEGVQNFARPAAELVAREVDLILTRSSFAAFAATDATSSIPIVVHDIGDVVENGLVPDLARPGGNITGVAMRSKDMALKRVELLREAFPLAKRPLLVHAPQPSHLRAAGFAVELARQLGLSPVVIQISPVAADMEPAKRAISDGADSLVMVAGTPSPKEVLSLVREFRLPAVFNADAYMDAGGAVNLDTVVDYVAVADYVDRILRGAKPGDLPILLPTEFQLVVNLSSATALGTPIAPSVVAAATKVIK